MIDDMLDRMAQRIMRLEQSVELGVHAQGSDIERARFIYFDAINSIREDSSGTPFANNGAVKYDYDSGTTTVTEWRAMAHLKQPLADLNAAFFLWATAPTLIFTTPDGDGLIDVTNITYSVYPVLQDWESASLTWSNAPSSFGTFKPISAEMSPGSFPDFASNGGTAVSVPAAKPSINRDDFYVQWGYNLGYRLSRAQLDAGARIFGFQIRVTGGQGSTNDEDFTISGSLSTDLIDSNNQPKQAAILY